MAEGSTSPRSAFDTLLAIDVGTHVEKKGKFSYLSWAYAVSELGKRYPNAEIEVVHFPLADAPHMRVPFCATPVGYFVEVEVVVAGVKRTCVHPVLDERNQTIKQPNAFDINRSIQRATAKAIALHGLGLNLYAGEDLPLGEDDGEQAKKRSAPKQAAPASTLLDDMRKAIGHELDRLAYVGSERKRIVVQYAAPHAADSAAGMQQALDKLTKQQAATTNG